MALLKKKPADEFHVPSLSEASPEYAGLIAKRQDLSERYSALNAEHSKLRDEIEKAKKAGGERLSPGVAALLGDAPDSLTMLSQRQHEVVSEMGNIEAAQEVIRRRLDEARNVASKVVCDTMRQEYRRRLGALCEAARALEAARRAHDELLDDLEREDVHLGHLSPVTVTWSIRARRMR